MIYPLRRRPSDYIQGLSHYLRCCLLPPDSQPSSSPVKKPLAAGQQALRAADFEGALSSFEQAVALDPFRADAHYGRALALEGVRRFENAVAAYDQVIAFKSDWGEAYLGRGRALLELKRPEAAITNFELALLLDPELAAAHFYRGEALRALGQPEAALDSYRSALELDPRMPQLRGLILFLERQICDWGRAEPTTADLMAALERGENATPPFSLLAVTDTPALHQAVATRFAAAIHPQLDTLGTLRPPATEKIRIGYYSADYENHPVMQLIAGVFECHDRSVFELTAFSFGRAVADDMRTRVAKAFDRFIDCRQMSNMEVASLSRELGIHIAIDLNGYTRDRRTGIFALRAAPLQVSYLGYPGTSGAPYMDYIIADRTVAPDEGRAHFSEKVARVPYSYQCNDQRRAASARIYTRRELGLPEQGLVFCCFNNNYKISPATFDSWMRIMERVPGSVLWLLEDNPVAAMNLRAEAMARGIDPGRLIFADRLTPADHLARHALADLFLDTLPYNAHTTASDALWMGLPVITRPGESFAARVGASLLQAAGLPELIVDTEKAYEDLAVALATGTKNLGALKAKLREARLTSPLFDTALFTRHFETLLKAMYDRQAQGLAPDHIDLQ